MTKEELLRILKECDENGDHEAAHGDADEALLAYIGDEEIEEAFNRKGTFWYA